MAAGVHLGISYSGTTKYRECGDWDIEGIDVTYDGAKTAISADIGGRFFFSKYGENLLQFRTPAGYYQHVRPQIDLDSAVARTIQLSARAFRVGEARRDVPISIVDLPEFKEGKHYRIQVTNNENSLKAIFVEIPPE